MTLEFPRQIFYKWSNITFHENPSSGSHVITCGQTDIIIIIIIIITIIIIILINFNSVVTRWQWLFYMYTKYEIGY